MLDRLGYDSGGDLAADLFLGASDWDRARQGYEDNDWGQLLSGAALGGLAVASVAPVGLMSRGGRQALQARMAPRMGDEFVDGSSLGANLGGGGPGRPAPSETPVAPVRRPEGAPVRDDLTDRINYPDPRVAEDTAHLLPDASIRVPWEGAELDYIASAAEQLGGRVGRVGLGRVGTEDLAREIYRSPSFQEWASLEKDVLEALRPGRAKNLRAREVADPAEAERYLQAFARKQGLELPPLTTPSGVIEEGLLGAVMRGDHLDAARSLSVQLRNASVFADGGLHLPDAQRFYPVFQRAFRTAEERSGMPAWMMNFATAGSSNQAAPWDEVARVFRAAPHMKMKDGRAYFDIAEAGVKPTSFVGKAGKLLEEAINNPDLFARRVPQMADKTIPYAVSRHDPRMQSAYVADTVDGLMRYWVRDGRTTVTGGDPELVRFNQFVGRLTSDIFGATPQRGQERMWGLARFMRDQANKTGGASRQGAFRGKIPGTDRVVDLDDFLTEASLRIPKDVRAHARARMADLNQRAQSGTDPNWIWDGQQGIATPRSVDQLIPPETRMASPDKGRFAGQPVAETLQRKMLRASVLLSEELRSKIMAFSVATGIPAAAMLQYIVEQQEDGPDRGPVTDADVQAMVDMMDDETADWV